MHGGRWRAVDCDANDPAVNFYWDDPSRVGKCARDIATATVDLDSVHAQTREIEIVVPCASVDLEIPRRVRVQLDGSAIATAAILDHNQARFVYFERCSTAAS